jgi:hypothetical protein
MRTAAGRYCWDVEQIVPTTSRNLWLYAADGSATGGTTKTLFAESSDAGRHWRSRSEWGPCCFDGVAAFTSNRVLIAHDFDVAAGILGVSAARDLLDLNDILTWGPIRSVGSRFAWVGAFHLDSATVYRTIDGGAHWFEVKLDPLLVGR